MSKLAALALAVLPACAPHDPSVVVDEALNQQIFDDAARLAHRGEGCADAVEAGQAPYECRTKVTPWYCGCWKRTDGVVTFDSNIAERDCSGAGGIPLYYSTTPFPGDLEPVEGERLTEE